MKKLTLVLSLLLLAACDGNNYYIDIDCGDAANKKLIKESFESCMKYNSSTSTTCASVTQKLFCKYTRVEIKKRYDQ